MSVPCIICSADVCEWESVLCCGGGWQPYWHFLRWFLWAYSIRITEGFHLVGSSLHAKEGSLETLFTNQVGFAALIRSQAKAQLPSNPLQYPPPAQHTHTPRPYPPVLQAFILSLILSLLYARIRSKLSRLRAFYVNLVAQKMQPWLQAKSASLKKTKKHEKRDTSKRIV